jgi:predicted ArsR family transcriptional regulator
MSERESGLAVETTAAIDDLGVLSSLAEPIRRALYEFVASVPEAVTRDAAAEAVGVSRQVAAYHLDRLADDGLLDFEFRRLTGREGPGAGRPSKLYHRSAQVYEVSMPPRRYQLAARILLEAVRAARVDDATLAEVARHTGAQLAGSGLAETLVETGYEPAVEDGETRFHNCPFHLLRDQDRDVTCGLNLALVEGMIEGSGSDATAVLAPEDGYCCVRLRPGVD